jgi:hypothetical protein
MAARRIAVLLALAGMPAWSADPCGPLLRQPYAPYTFMGFACRDSTCAAHKGGFVWAERAHITDVLACAGAQDQAFREGCRAYVQDSVTAEQSGFQWALENEVGDACLCDGAGQGFAAGCEAYISGFFE